MNELVFSKYVKFVRACLSPAKVQKGGFRLLMKNRIKLQLFHAILGMRSEVDELFLELRGCISGASRWPTDLTNVREELGDIGFFFVNGAKLAKVKIPSLKKKIKLTGTKTENLLLLNDSAGRMLDLAKRICYGEELNLEAIQKELEVFGPLYWGVVLQLLGEGPEGVLIENVAKLEVRYKDGFSPEAAALRADKDDEPVHQDTDAETSP